MQNWQSVTTWALTLHKNRFWTGVVHCRLVHVPLKWTLQSSVQINDSRHIASVQINSFRNIAQVSVPATRMVPGKPQCATPNWLLQEFTPSASAQEHKRVELNALIQLLHHQETTGSEPFYSNDISIHQAPEESDSCGVRIFSFKKFSIKGGLRLQVLGREPLTSELWRLQELACTQCDILDLESEILATWPFASNSLSYMLHSSNAT